MALPSLLPQTRLHRRSPRPPPPAASPPAQGPGLLDMPIELLRRIDLKLHHADHRSFTQTCTALHAALHDPVTLRLRDVAVAAALSAHLKAVGTPGAGMREVVEAADTLVGNWTTLLRHPALERDVTLHTTRIVARGWTLTNTSLEDQPQAIARALRLMHTLQSLSAAIRQDNENDIRPLGLQLLLGGIAWQVFLGTDWHDRSAMHARLRRLVLLPHTMPGASGHVLSLIEMLKWIGPTDRADASAELHVVLDGWPEAASRILRRRLPPRPTQATRSGWPCLTS